MKLLEFLTANTGKSSMRLCFLLCIVTGCIGGMILCIIDLFKNQGKNIAAIALVIGAYLTPSFWGKINQKKNETQVKE